ncbi:hypothetical protein [Bacillus sp. XF8]|uniref:hypothetical protein n=1 Tax=Bacillus sp. XF8 TaxID=2819289 RepID=UPI001FB5B3A0|nr:hypothetical protein [Bacillus sp. XF8]
MGEGIEVLKRFPTSVANNYLLADPLGNMAVVANLNTLDINRAKGQTNRAKYVSDRRLIDAASIGTLMYYHDINQ